MSKISKAALLSDSRSVQMLTTIGVDPRFTLSRAQVSAICEIALGDDSIYTAVGADTPRVVRAPVTGRNQLRNPNFEGAVAGVIGAGATLPSYIGYAGTSGITCSIVGVFDVDGMKVFRLSVDGTASGSGAITFIFETAQQIAAAAGQVWSNSIYLSRDIGAGAEPAFRLRMLEHSSNGTQVAASSAGISETVTNTLTRYIRQYTTTQSNCAFVRNFINIVVVGGLTYSTIVDIAIPQLERAAAAGVPTRPAAGQLVASVNYARAGTLMVEGQRTNRGNNPLCVGAVPGSPGTLPTFWTLSGTLGLSADVAGTGVVDGLAYTDIRFYGTPTSSNFIQVNFGSSVGGVADGEVWTMSAFLALVAGSLTNVGTTSLAIGGGSANTSAPHVLTTDNIGNCRREASVTLAGGAVTLLWRWRVNVTNGLPVDFTVRFAHPQVEKGSFASSPVAPSTAVATTSSRGADTINSTLARLGVTQNGACTIAGVARLYRASALEDQLIIHVDDSTGSNRYGLLMRAGGDLSLFRALAGSLAYQTSGVTITNDTFFAFVLSYDGSGRAVLSINGGTPVMLTGGPSSGLTHLRIGNSVTGLFGMFGEFKSLLLRPFSMPDALVQAMSASLPR